MGHTFQGEGHLSKACHVLKEISWREEKEKSLRS
jgi:hypothetical protein